MVQLLAPFEAGDRFHDPTCGPGGMLIESAYHYRDEQVVINDSEEGEMRVAVPSECEEIVDYGRDLEGVQAEKRKHIDQIIKFLGLDIHDRVSGARGPSEGPERPLVEYRDVSDDDTDYDAR